MMWPFSRKSAEPETKSLADPSPELLALFAGTAVGTISEGEALSVPAVSSAVRLISEAAASLCLKVKRKEGDAEVDAPEHTASTLLTGQVNSWTSSYEFVRDMVASALISDTGGIAVVTKVRRQPREIIAYRRGTVTVDYDPLTDEPTYRNAGAVLASDTVIHLRPPLGRAPLTLARESIALAKAMETHASSLWRNGAKPGGLLTSKGRLSSEDQSNVRTLWAAAYGGANNTGKTAFLPADLDYKEIALNSTDAQFLENRKFQIIEVSRAFRVPPSMLFELDRATWSNAQQMGREFLTYTLEPWLQALEAALNRALFTSAERALGYRVWFERDDLTRADMGERATAYSSLISSRVINPNTAREWEGLPPYDDGDAYANPHTGSSQAGTPPQSPTGGKPPPETRNDQRQRPAA